MIKLSLEPVNGPDLQLRQVILTDIFRFWQKIRAGKEMPAPRDIRLFDIPPALLPHLSFVEVVRQPRLRFRWRFAGAHIAVALGRDLSGSYWDEIYDAAELAGWQWGAETVLEHRAPLRADGPCGGEAGDMNFDEALFMPLSEDGRTVDTIMMGSVYNTTTVTDASDVMDTAPATVEFPDVAELAPMGVAITRRDNGVVLYANALGGRLFGLSHTELIGRSIADFRAEAVGQADTFRTVGSPSSIIRQEMLMRRDDGGTFTAMLNVSLIVHDGVDAVLTMFEDISERILKEKELTASHQLLQSLIDGIPEFIALKDAGGRYLFVNRVFEEWYGISRQEAVGTTMYDYLSEAEADVYQDEESKASREQTAIIREVEARWPDGMTRNTVMIRFPVFDETGNVIARGISGRDVTQLRASEVAAAEAQEQLRQAQKMEAIGQLTGGIAHDFNNILAAILGNLEMLKDHVAGHDEAVTFANRGISVTKRGVELTHRLLAFSRRQELRPVAVDISRLVLGMNDLLARTLGASVEIKFTYGIGLWHCEVDPGQMENAILNLSINARDAMSKGGQLTIETANVRLDGAAASSLGEVAPGEYVRLAISDTGTGMAETVVDRAFDPFFTTKDVGKGTGLGLSMVYGFAQQSRGMAKILSEPGAGTTIQIYLPRTEQAEIKASAVDAITAAKPALAGEVILVVEDHEDVRALTTSFLEKSGYQVLAAENAARALAQLEQLQRIDLMLADIVLPGGMDGRELVGKARTMRPDLKFLYMSGFTRSEPLTRDHPDDGVQILMKPFPIASLAQKIREILDPASEKTNPG